jgi:hypothetical protein
MDIDKIIETILVALISSGLGSAITARSLRRKNDAEASQAIAEAAKSLIAPLTDRVDALEAELKRFKRGVDRLIAQIRCLGHEPDWTPEMDLTPAPRRNGGDAAG